MFLPLEFSLGNAGGIAGLGFLLVLAVLAVILIFVKEIFQLIAGIVRLRKGKMLKGAQITGKICTTVLFISLIVLVMMPLALYAGFHRPIGDRVQGMIHDRNAESKLLAGGNPEAWSGAGERSQEVNFSTALWHETLEGEQPFTVEFCDGAKGKVEIIPGAGRNGSRALLTEKSNNTGYIVIKFKKVLPVKNGDKLQFNPSLVQYTVPSCPAA